MNEIWLYSLLSVFVVSLISFIGVVTLGIKTERLKKILIYFISFSAGALMGDVFLHLLPESVEENGFGLNISGTVLLGIFVSFLLEKVIHWRHCHMPHEKGHVHSFAYMNLFGDGLHNFVDGAVIAASYIVSIPVGIATTLAVLFHEIPQEIGDFGVLLHGGFSKGRALLLNFASALMAVLGAVIALWLNSVAELTVAFLVPFAAGSFIYIAGSDLIPELHKNTTMKTSILQALTFLLGILVMAVLLILE
ncbi:ZIP family metal transporter [Candidatus Pacearchaeota archaeon]|nr:ZIP family metal transporter [Candidatus Pacearchaeota archaeon]